MAVDVGSADAHEDEDISMPPELAARLARLPLQRIERKRDLKRIAFTDGFALILFDARLIPEIRFKNDARADAARVRRLARVIAARGYDSSQPVVCRIGQKGKWIVVDGGHRLSALRTLYRTRPCWRLAAAIARLGEHSPRLRGLARRLSGGPVMVYAILFLGPRSFTKRPGGAP